MVADPLSLLVEPIRRRLDGAVAAQQPHWTAHPDLPGCRAVLAEAPAPVSAAEVAEVQRAVAVVAGGNAQVLQLGDCAESFHEVGEEHVRAKLGLLHGLADELARRGGQEVLRVGRLGGQFAKPRSQLTERVGDRTLPVFRGHMVNSEEPTPAARRHDPRRMLQALAASAAVLGQVRADRTRRAGGPFAAGPWASHDALVLDYEASLVRAGAGRRFLASTHLPWIGDRTRQPGSAHVRLLAALANPVACKVGPTTDLAALRAVCARLDPDREPGRLTLIVRLGAGAVADLLPRLVAAVRSWGHPVVWLSDPMHGNTIRVGGGLKTRRLDDVVTEAVRFRRILRRCGAHPGGLHLEVAATDVTECVGGPVRDVDALPRRYTTLCDPRLNPTQTAELLRHWAEA
ncbi:3-deoxy-D-arabinoheptulosonate-7-phosphate synthase [Amycolatopsis arida]|uniref:Phospho-2-dehydro-3-deoxyheptonate aldolase n=1 Tax=Amycolatopsis arida TaxID=587909 RepID=A0A1I5V5V9_9PSEU|nr:3-deoxy-7-phosphoheptulonate synthase [Amycolatopsis arida]TDX91161.1 3-deoxy-D-arabinoheptulosonate-7-phosphate synthase [Amycolatopsis arida]SFQ02850.1 3-deoxy-D-arabinoheptulosonate-7-phosphate synthase [Amycolatopsis arida]